MKKLTKGQRFALAREARRLAMECVEGTMPKLNPYSYCGCAAHEVAVRAGFSRRGERIRQQSSASNAAEQLAELIPFDSEERRSVPLGFFHLIDAATYQAVTEQDPGLLVFPLLATADALEASAASVPKAPPEAP